MNRLNPSGMYARVLKSVWEKVSDTTARSVRWTLERGIREGTSRPVWRVFSQLGFIVVTEPVMKTKHPNLDLFVSDLRQARRGST